MVEEFKDLRQLINEKKAYQKMIFTKYMKILDILIPAFFGSGVGMWAVSDFNKTGITFIVLSLFFAVLYAFMLRSVKAIEFMDTMEKSWPTKK